MSDATSTVSCRVSALKLADRVRRCWNPNVQKKKVYSDVLGRKLSVRMTTYVMRCIDKAGGFDNYILHTKPKDLASKLAMKIRDEMHQVLRAKQLAKAAAKATESKPATA